MRAFRTHLWKEWREHRAVLLGILVALPVLTAATFVGFASFGAQLANGAAVFTGGAAAMTALALSVELFAGEVTRRTLGFWRRQPGGLAIGWAAKVAMLVLAVSLATLWGGICFWTACRTWVGAKAADGAWGSLVSPDAYLVPALSLAFAAWVLLVSTWIPRGAAAVGLAALLLAAIAFPGFVLWGERAAFLRTLIPGVALAVVAGICFPLALSALSCFVGRRRSDRPLRAALACVAIVALGGGAAYAHANAKLDRWLDVRLGDADAYVTSIFVGEGGHVAYASLTRDGDDTVRCPFAIDLATGVGRRIGPSGTVMNPWGDEAGAFGLATGRGVGAGIGLFERYSGFEIDATRATMELFDGATGRSLGEHPLEPLEGRELEFKLDTMRSRRRITTPVRTLDGRKAWSLRRPIRSPHVKGANGKPVWAAETWIERETADGGVERIDFPAFASISAFYATPLGWSGQFGEKAVFIPADVRSPADFVPFELPGKGSGNQRVDARRSLWRRYSKIPGGLPSPSWRVVDVVAGSDEPAPGFDDNDRLLRIADGHALVWRRPRAGASAEETGGLASIDLTTGVRGPDASRSDGVPPTMTDLGFVGLTPSGKVVLVGGSFGGSWMNEPGLLVYNPDLHEMGRWTPTRELWGGNVAAIVDEDTIYVYGHERRSWGTSQTLDRVRLGTGERSRLFPR